MFISERELLVNVKGVGAVTCPHCGKQNKGRVKNFLAKKGESLNLKCADCTKRFPVVIRVDEPRKCVRKNVLESGIDLDPRLGSLQVLLHDISRKGLRFSCTKNTKFSVGQEIVMSLTFPSNKSGPIDFQLRIVSVDDDQCGCEFLNAERGSRALKAVGFFLQDMANNKEN